MVEKAGSKANEEESWQASRGIIALFGVVKIIILQSITTLKNTQHLP